MKTHERLSYVLDRQRHYRAFDVFVALVFAFGLSVTALAVVLLLPSARSAADSPVALDTTSSAAPTAYTAQFLANAPDRP